VLRGPLIAGLALIASLAAHLAVSGWGQLTLMFADQSHPAEYRFGTATIVMFLAISLTIFATAMIALLALAYRLPRAWHLPLTAIIFSAFWAQSALSIAGWMAEADGGGTWLWYEPFTELFFHPIATPLLFATGLTAAIWAALRTRPGG
jgi:hypothetical protein